MSILVTAKINPDLDGVSCALGYAHFLRQAGKDAEAVIFGSPQAEVRYFIEQHGMAIPAVPEDTAGDWTEFVLVDASSMKGIPKPVVADKVIEVIDHRAGEPEMEFPNARIQNELIGAAATLVTERYMHTGMKPIADHAKLLYGGIYHNTFDFIASNTNGRDRVAARYLEQECDVSPSITRDMFTFATDEILSDVYRALRQDAKEFGMSGYTVGAYQLIVWGDEIFSQKELIEKSVGDLSKEMGVEWSYLNIVNIQDRTSTIFLSEKIGRATFSKVFGMAFDNPWTHLPHLILRKQIMAALRRTI
jgi:manganese-dependent inorganic pyrophosphatase